MATASKADDPPEIWRDIPGWEGFYQASSSGGVRSLTRVLFRAGRRARYRGRELKQFRRKDGYLVVQLTRDGEQRPYLVHGLVCLAFHGARPSGDHQAAHNDGSRDYNAAGNLRWATRSENQLDRRAHGTNRNPGRASITLQVATEIKARLRSGEMQKLIARDLGTTRNVVSQISRGLSWADVA